MTPLIYKLFICFFSTTAISGAGVGIWKTVEYYKTKDSDAINGNKQKENVLPSEPQEVPNSSTGELKISEDIEKPEGFDTTKEDDKTTTKFSNPNPQTTIQNIPTNILIEQDNDDTQPQQYVITNLKNSISYNQGNVNDCGIKTKNNLSIKFVCKVYELSDELQSKYKNLNTTENIEIWKEIDKENTAPLEDNANKWVESNKFYKFVFTENTAQPNQTFKNVKEFWTNSKKNEETSSAFILNNISSENKLCFRNTKSNSSQQKSFCWTA